MARSVSLVLVLGLALSSTACPRGPKDSHTPVAGDLVPPVAKRIPHELTAHGHTRVDDYYWMRERDDPQVIAYLEAENAYTEAATAKLAPLRRELLDEMIGRIEQVDESVPVDERGWLYYRRWTEGADHPIFCRKQGSVDAPEQVILDAQALAAGHAYFAVDELEPSESQNLLAYSVDTIGRRFYTIEVKDLASGELLTDRILETAGSIEWAADDRTLYYVKQDPETLRHNQVLRHTIGTDTSADELVYEEADETFDVGLGRSQSRAYLLLHSGSTMTDEVHLLDAARPDASPQLFAARERGLEYSVDHLDGFFYVLTNLDAPNFRVMRTAVARTDRSAWTELIAHRDDVLIEDLLLFRQRMVVSQRRRGLTELSVHGLDGKLQRELEFDDPAYLAYASDNPNPDSLELRYVYESLTTPETTYEVELSSGARTLLDQQQVPGGFVAADYVSERLAAPGRDGVEIPVSLVMRRDTPKDGSAPLLLYAYGAYGSSEDAYFSTALLSLLDRGFVYAIAHVRGGEELGRQWYEDGKLLHKQNSFLDFIDCAEFLVASGHVDAGKLFAEGGSAGGLLVGAVVNMRPELWRGAVAAVPFVDVVTTMLDEDIPLTTSEYDEWGDPNERVYYDYMLSYSPYDNVGAHAYPAMLVTAGLHDSQVQYWEPAKWVAKLRASKTDGNLLLLRTDMSAGHGGKSGRLAALEEVAFEYAFLLSLLEREGAG